MHGDRAADARGERLSRGSYAFTLPWPPSVNTYWRMRGRMVFISARGRAYREEVAAVVQEQRAAVITGRVGVSITAYPPDRRRRDLDNTLKALLDGLQHAGVFLDDEQVDDLRICRGKIVPDGALDVIVHELDPIAARAQNSRGKTEPR